MFLELGTRVLRNCATWQPDSFSDERGGAANLPALLPRNLINRSQVARISQIARMIISLTDQHFHRLIRRSRVRPFEEKL